MTRCARCGREEISLIEGLCTECFIYTRGIDLKFEMTIEQCHVCGRVRIDNKWISGIDELNEWMNKKVTEKYSRIFNKYGLIISDTTIVNNNFEVKITKEGRKEIIKGNIGLSIKKGVCPVCLREKQESFEAVIQVRSEDKSEMEKVRTVVEKIINNLPHDKVSEILVIDELKEGIDLKVYSHSAARFIANRIKSMYPSELRETHKLITIKGGKRQSKLTISVRLLKTSGYEVVYYKDKPAIIVYQSTGKIKMYLHNGNSLIISRKTLGKDVKPFRGSTEIVEFIYKDDEYVYVKTPDLKERKIPVSDTIIHVPIGSRALLVEDENGETILFPICWE